MKQGTQSQGTGTAQMDGIGREVGGGFRMWGHMYTHSCFMSMYGRNYHDSVKELASNSNR